MINTKDTEHLDLLKLFHYIVGGMGCLASCFPLIHVLMGVLFLTESMAVDPGDGSRVVGGFFVVIGLTLFILGQAVSICIILSGKYIKQRKNYMFSFVIACISCLACPIGTVLGVFTIVVLGRDTVKHLYKQEKQQYGFSV